MELIFEPGQIPFSTEEISTVTFYSFNLNGEAEGIASAFSIPDLNRFLALRLKSIWWMIPAYGETAAEIPTQTQLLLGRLPDRRYLLLMPLVDRDLRATLQGNPQTGKADMHTPAHKAAHAARRDSFVFIRISFIVVTFRKGNPQARLLAGLLLQRMQLSPQNHSARQKYSPTDGRRSRP